VKGSRFLGLVSPIRNEDEAKDFLVRARKEFHDARHHCSAWRIGIDGKDFRSSDDGEPSGSAGKPILAMIEGRELSNVAVVVVRWFGGTKLGVGGLVRAYGQAAAEALDGAPQETVILRRTFVFRHTYEMSGPVQGLLNEYQFVPLRAEYGEAVQFELEIPLPLCDKFQADFVERTAGRGEIKETT
ncbi:UNVERIFIED_CONTAM: hypothetical protein GTU68_015463, partial [Idotea baltica]|nr:hypothetical protein [Idotea baltica]